MLCRCWLGSRKGIWSVKNEWLCAGLVVCLGLCADLYMAQLMPLTIIVSCFSKSRLVLPFWYQLTWVVPDRGTLNGCCSILNYFLLVISESLNWIKCFSFALLLFPLMIIPLNTGDFIAFNAGCRSIKNLQIIKTGICCIFILNV